MDLQMCGWAVWVNEFFGGFFLEAANNRWEINSWKLKLNSDEYTILRNSFIHIMANLETDITDREGSTSV